MKWLDKIIIGATNIKNNKRIVAITLSFFIAFSFWIFITLSQTYQHTFSYPIKFVDKKNPKMIYDSKYSFIKVQVEASGFNMLWNKVFNKRNNVIIDVNKLNFNRTIGYYKLPIYTIKGDIAHILGYSKINITPDTIPLKWSRTIVKPIKIVCDCSFKCKKPFALYKEPTLLINEVLVEGRESVLSEIDTVYTDKIRFENISFSNVFLVPLKAFHDSLGLKLSFNTSFLKLDVQEFTEDVINVNVKPIKYKRMDNLKLFPSNVKVKYRVALKDYKRVNAEEFSAYVVCDDNNSENKKLKVFLNNVPEYVHVVSIMPEKVDYVIFK